MSYAAYVNFFLATILSQTLVCEPVFAADEALNWRYTVRLGDNLINFGKAHLINPDDWKVLQQLNQVKNPYQMQAGSTLNVPLKLVRQGAAEAEVMLATGDAQLENGNAFTPLSVGQKLGPGASLVTKGNSKVVIKFADGTQTSMASNSKLVLDTLSIYSGGGMVDTKLRLQQGQVETQANPNHVIGNKMQIITPTAIAAVRGTQFRVTADAASLKQETLEGKVALTAAGQEVAVDKGYGSFAEAGQAPSPPIVLLAAADTTQLSTKFDSLPVRFNMPAQAGAVAWAGKVSADSHFNQVLAEVESAGSSIDFNDIANGKYYLTVRAKDKNGLGGYDAQHTFTVKARPFAPNLVFPAKGAVVRDAQPSLQWDAVAEAKLYAVELATDAEFKSIVTTSKVDARSYQIGQALVPGQYFWRVASIAKDADGVEDQGPLIHMSQFTYKARPPAPDISQLNVKVETNRVFVHTIAPLDGMHYQVTLYNPFNKQEKVWVGADLQEAFSFLLKEYGKQVLSIVQVDADGVTGPEALYAFDAPAQ